jgi:hypothetical protein
MNTMDGDAWQTVDAFVSSCSPPLLLLFSPFSGFHPRMPSLSIATEVPCFLPSTIAIKLDITKNKFEITLIAFY